MAVEKKETKKTTAAPKKVGRPKKTVEPEVVAEAPEIASGSPENEPKEVKDTFTENEQETPENVPESFREYIVKTKKPGNVLNVRSGAGKEFPVVRQIENGTTVTVYETANGFGRIAYGQWVMLDLLQ